MELLHPVKRQREFACQSFNNGRLPCPIGTEDRHPQPTSIPAPSWRAHGSIPPVNHYADGHLQGRGQALLRPLLRTAYWDEQNVLVLECGIDRLVCEDLLQRQIGFGPARRRIADQFRVQLGCLIQALRQESSLRGRGSRTAGDRDEVEHVAFSANGINSWVLDFAHDGDPLGRVLKHENLDVRIAQNLSLAKTLLDRGLHLFRSESLHLDGSTNR